MSHEIDRARMIESASLEAWESLVRAIDAVDDAELYGWLVGP
jgi:hypothetical protein